MVELSGRSLHETVSVDLDPICMLPLALTIFDETKVNRRNDLGHD